MRGPDMPPRWAEVILEAMLATDDRLTIAGDLREEYTETILPDIGRWRADLWYFRHAASLVPQCIIRESGMRRLLLLSSVFNLVCGCWLITMESFLRHPGYAGRAVIVALISLVPLATIVVVLLHCGARTERWFQLCGLPLLAFSLWAFARNARSTHFEGFVLVVSLALTIQSILMLASLGRTPRGFRLERMEGTR